MPHEADVLTTTAVGRRFLRALAERATPDCPSEEAYAAVGAAVPVAVDEGVFAAHQPDAEPGPAELAWARRIGAAAEFAGWWGDPGGVRRIELAPRAPEPEAVGGPPARDFAEGPQWELGPGHRRWTIAEVGGLRPTLEAIGPRVGLSRAVPMPAGSRWTDRPLVVIDTAADWAALIRRHGQVIEVAAKAYWADWAPGRWGWTASDDLVVPAWGELASAAIAGVYLSPGGYLHLEGTAVRDGARLYPLVGWAPGLAVLV